MEHKKIHEYFKLGQYEEIAHMADGLNEKQIEDTDIIRKVAESYRRLGKAKESIPWMERLVVLKPESRYLDKIKDLYLIAQVSEEKWQWLLNISKDKNKEVYAIANYYYEKANDTEEKDIKKLLSSVLEVVSYEDEIYFEAARLLDNNYYLNQIISRTHNEVNRKKAESLLGENGLQNENQKQTITKIKRQIPKAIEDFFENIVGMENIKEELGALYNHLKMHEKDTDNIPVPYNFIIAGQKGSGKTTLAYIITDILKELELTKYKDPLEISALSLLEGGEILENASSVVIINNTECLVSDKENNQNWLVFEQLLEEACKKKDRFYLFLGETENMESLINNNPKTKNFATYLKIPVYTGKELHRIGLNMIEKDGYENSPDGKERFYQELRKKSALGDFANGHTVQNVIIEAKKNMAYRKVKEENKYCFEEEDFILQDTREETLEELLAKLKEMTGLASVKKEVEEKIALYMQNEANRKSGIEEEESVTLNTLLLGPPGTGKTTVARLLGKIYAKIGLLPRGDIFIEVTRESLVAGYSGQTALKVDDLVKKAMGGVLFIDEAYNLVNGDHDEFGKEAFNTLLTKAENYRDRLMVIMAGYEEPMHQLISVNEGMARRFPHELHFEKYTEEELFQIMKFMLKKRHYFLHMDAETAVKRLIKGKMCNSNFGNAGEIRNMLEGMIQKLSLRVLQQNIEGSVDRRTIRKVDVDEYVGRSAENEKTLEDYLDELNALTGLENVKKHIMDEIKSAKIAQERARRAGVKYSPGTLHMLLTGNAGTGKTTVARLIGKIYGKAGLIKNPDVFVEIRRESLVAGYMGQTGTKVMREVEKASGGVMFIDEAYNLVNGDHDEFGKDALNTLIAPIENNRDDLMVIMAGYEEEMEDLLNHNQGLRSRLNTKLVLDDYTIEQMVEIFYRKAESEGYRLEEDLQDCVAAYIRKEMKKAYPDFGNARGVRNCYETVVRRMNSRLASYEDTLPSDSHLQQISDEDISIIRREDIEGDNS